MDRVLHLIQPIYNQDSKVLILGTFPSVKSREGQFFYHHPQNRFWKIISSIYEEELPKTIEEKKQLLLRNNIAVWDVIHSCEIVGSSDSSIKNVIPNDLSVVLHNSDVTKVITNGGLAFKLYMIYLFPKTGIEAINLPSTSPANAGFSFERLYEKWKCLKDLTERLQRKGIERCD